MWWYSDPSMYITQSVIQKEYEKEGFRCDPLNYDGFYDSALGYDECLLKVRAPTLDSVVLTGNEYSFIPFDPRLVRQRDGTGVVKSIYNPVGGGTSKKVLAETEAQIQADMDALYAEQLENPTMGPGAFQDFSYDPDNPYESFGDNFDSDTGSYGPGGFFGGGDDGGSGGFDGSFDDGGSGGDPNDPYASFGDTFDSDTGSYGSSGSVDANDSGGSSGSGDADVSGGDTGGDPGGALDPGDGGDMGGMGNMSSGRRRSLLQDDDEDVEYEGLADLSGCNCNMVVTYEEGDARLADGEEHEEKNKELKFYKVADASDASCYPVDGAAGEECTMTKAKAVLMFRQFLSVNDPCEFVKRSSPFQCVREEASPLTQRLSLAYANSGLLYGVLCAMAVNYMYATKKVTLETVDIEQLQKLASMNKVSAEEQPAK